MYAFNLIPHKCKQCGKKFEGTKDYAYKIGHEKKGYKWFCSWHCLRDYQKGVKPGETVQRDLRRQEAV